MVSKERILRKGLSDEVKRTILREGLDRYRHELLDDEERQILHDRVLKLSRELGLHSCSTVRKEVSYD